MADHTRTLRTYREKFGAPPLFFPALSEEERKEAFDLMAAAIESGKALTDKDVEKFTNIERPEGTQIL